MEASALNSLKAGKSKEQQKVLDYFLKEGCCTMGVMSDDDYSSLVKSTRDSLRLREKALSKIGIDEDELKEIPPACLEGYVFENSYAKRKASGNWVSSSYQVAWIFCSSTQIYIYRCTFCLDESKKNESTDEFFYKDVTSVSTSSGYDATKSTAKDGKKVEVESHKFVMVVPGDKLYVSMDGVENAESIIQAMKQKLREKKLG